MNNTYIAPHTVLDVIVYTNDVVTTAKFYSDLLNSSPTKGDMADPDEEFIQFQLSNTRIIVEPFLKNFPSEGTIHQNPIQIRFTAKDKEDAQMQTNHVKALGIELLEDMTETHYGIITLFNDPEGNRLEIIYQF